MAANTEFLKYRIKFFTKLVRCPVKILVRLITYAGCPWWEERQHAWPIVTLFHPRNDCQPGPESDRHVANQLRRQILEEFNRILKEESGQMPR